MGWVYTRSPAVAATALAGHQVGDRARRTDRLRAGGPDM